MSSDTPKKRRKILLIDKKFQLKFSFYVCSWIFALSLTFPLIIYSLFDWIIHYSESYLGADSAPMIEQVRSEVFLNLAFLEVSFVGLTFLISMFLSHKIAGPVYKMKKTFKESLLQPLDLPVKFRKGDHFQELADSYNELVSHRKQNKDLNIETLSSVIARVEALSLDDANLRDILTELRQMRDRLTI